MLAPDFRASTSTTNLMQTGMSNWFGSREKMMRRYGILILLAALLLGCATPAERAARVQAEVDEMIQVYSPGCEKLGYTKDSDQWRECILHLATRDAYLYHTHPTTTTCIGHRGFYNCTTY